METKIYFWSNASCWGRSHIHEQSFQRRSLDGFVSSAKLGINLLNFISYSSLENARCRLRFLEFQSSWLQKTYLDPSELPTHWLFGPGMLSYSWKTDIFLCSKSAQLFESFQEPLWDVYRVFPSFFRKQGHHWSYAQFQSHHWESPRFFCDKCSGADIIPNGNLL